MFLLLLLLCFKTQSLRHLCQRIPGREDIETFRLKMVLRYDYCSQHPSHCSEEIVYCRLLQISSFSGKMNALNEVYPPTN